MIYKILEEISKESSTNEKMIILSKYKDNKTLKDVLYLTYSGRIKFHIKNIPVILENCSTMTLEDAIVSLSEIYNRKKTGNVAIEHLKNIISSCSIEDSIVITRIIGRDLKIGMGSRNINKVFPKLIEEIPYMGAKPYSKKGIEAILKKGDAYSQIKMDGQYVNVIKINDTVELFSRQGEETFIYGAKFVKSLSNIDDIVLNGELTIPGIPRYASNGIITSLIDFGKKKNDNVDTSKKEFKFFAENGMTIQQALDRIQLTCWDCVPFENFYSCDCKIPYNKRFEKLQNVLKDLENVKVVDYKILSTFEDVMKHFTEAVSNGEEGTVVKEFDGVWKNGKPSSQCKVKKKETFDLKVVAFNYGEKGTKNERRISSLDVTSEDGLLKTSPFGINEEDMEYITNNMDNLMGKIVEVKCCGVSHDSFDNYSLLHPIFIKFREDISTANTLEECLEKDRMVTELGGDE